MRNPFDGEADYRRRSQAAEILPLLGRPKSHKWQVADYLNATGEEATRETVARALAHFDAGTVVDEHDTLEPWDGQTPTA